MHLIAYTQHHSASTPLSEALMLGGFIIQQRDCPVRVTEIGSIDMLLAVSGGLFPRAGPHVASLHALGAVRAVARTGLGHFASTRRTPEAVMEAIQQRFSDSMQASHPGLKAGASLATLHLRHGKVTCLSTGDVRAFRCTAIGELEQISRDHTFAQSMRDHGEPIGERDIDPRLHRAEHALFAGVDAESPPVHRQVVPLRAGDTVALLSLEVWVHVKSETVSSHLCRPDLRDAMQSLREHLLAHDGTGSFSIIAAR